MQANVDELLARARARLTRLAPSAAWQAMQHRGLLVDIRSEHQRREFGDVPGAVVVDRNVLEWRLDPASQSRLPIASYDAHVIVLCQQGYSSSFAAAMLQQLGVVQATDVVGGMDAWLAAGLPRRFDRGR